MGGWISFRFRRANSAARWDTDGAVNTTFSLICWTTRMISAGAMMLPTRQPVMVKFLEKEFRTMVRLRIPGRDAKGTNSV